MYRFKRESWVRKMQDTYADAITRSSQHYGYHTTTEDYMNWGEEAQRSAGKSARKRKRTAGSNASSGATDENTPPPSKKDYRKHSKIWFSVTGYGREFVPTKCKDHAALEDESYQTLPYIRIHTPPGAPTRRRDTLKQKSAVSAPGVLSHHQVAPYPSAATHRSYASEKLPKLRSHPLVHREEVKPDPKLRAKLAANMNPLSFDFRKPWKVTSVIRRTDY